MSVQRITLSKTYVQDEHQRMQQALARGIDGVTTSTSTALVAPREIDLGFVYVTSTSAGQSQQCIKTLILVNSSGYQARFYYATMPFAGNVCAIVCDCQNTIASAQTITLYKNNVLFTSFNVAASAPSGYINLSFASYPFNAGDTFYATVTYATAVSSTATASFIKLYIKTSV